MRKAKIEIPQFLLEMAKQLNEQDNRLTANPLFEVRYKKLLVTEAGYNESHWEILDDDGQTLYHSEKSESFDGLASFLFENESGWCDEWIAKNDLSDVQVGESVFAELFNEHFDPEFDDLPDSVKKLHLQEIEVTVNSHFTETDAKAFIKRKQHDYPKLYIYAIGMAYCWRMIELREWIMGLHNEPSQQIEISCQEVAL